MGSIPHRTAVHLSRQASGRRMRRKSLTSMKAAHLHTRRPWVSSSSTWRPGRRRSSMPPSAACVDHSAHWMLDWGSVSPTHKRLRHVTPRKRLQDRRLRDRRVQRAVEACRGHGRHGFGRRFSRRSIHSASTGYRRRSQHLWSQESSSTARRHGASTCSCTHRCQSGLARLCLLHYPGLPKEFVLVHKRKIHTQEKVRDSHRVRERATGRRGGLRFAGCAVRRRGSHAGRGRRECRGRGEE